MFCEIEFFLRKFGVEFESRAALFLANGQSGHKLEMVLNDMRIPSLEKNTRTCLFSSQSRINTFEVHNTWIKGKFFFSTFRFYSKSLKYYFLYVKENLIRINILYLLFLSCHILAIKIIPFYLFLF